MRDVSDLMYLSGVSVEKRIDCFGMGFGMHLYERMPVQIEEYQQGKREELKERDRVVMAIMDDKSGSWTSPVLTAHGPWCIWHAPYSRHCMLEGCDRHKDRYEVGIGREIPNLSAPIQWRVC
jgi:hypothetical protein